MDVSSSAPTDAGSDYQMALLSRSLDQMKVQGAQVTTMIASAGSVNSPSQGRYIDAHA
jgi:hypothetical protein